MRIAFLLFALGLAAAIAQESPSPSPFPVPSSSPPASSSPAPLRKVPLRFALPPFEGTISLGIYDSAGKLVRVLHREDDVADFTAGHDALETTWDGTDEAGHPLPDGKYSARGYVVGDLKVEGIDYFFNDWVTDETSPHLLRLTQLWMENGQLLVNADLPGDKKSAFLCDQTTGAILNETTPVIGVHCKHTPTYPNIVDCAEGKDGTIWFVASLDPQGPRQVKQVARNREVLRRLDYAAGDPPPERIEASTTDEKIFLLEQDARRQRFRGLALVRTTTDGIEGPVSDWKSLFQKEIIPHQNFGVENGKPVASATAPAQPQKFSQKLRADPLQHDAPGKVELTVGFDEDGSFLQTADGLPLRTISDTQHLSRALAARPNDDALDAFQDDGAVVEQFRISNLAEMIAFDCGSFELK
ncbi:MAG: FlgD immunoglobulin-like domain containing protein [Spartobacteria bacterium]